MISTGVAPLKDKLPDGTENNNTKTFYLRETVTPIGYKGDENTHRVVITATITRYPDEKEDKIVVKTSYVITIDGATAVSITNKIQTKLITENASIMVTNKDQDGAELSGSTFKLYAEEGCTTEISTYTGGSFEISTGETPLKNYLPTETGTDNASILYLRETEAPTDYDTDTTIHTVIITNTETNYLDVEKNAYIKKTTYGITVDNQTSIVVTNKKHTDNSGEEGNTTITGTEGIATGGNDGDPVITEENGNTTTDGKENNVTIEEGGGTTATGNNGNGMTGGESGKTTTGSTGETSATGMKRDAGAKHSSPRLGAEKTNTNKNNEISGMQAEDIIEPEVQMNWVTSVLQKTVEILTTVLELLSNILNIGFLIF